MRCKNKLFLCCVIALFGLMSNSTLAQQKTVSVVYVDVARDIPAGVPAYLTRPEFEGYHGAAIAIEDANITGKFMGYGLQLAIVNVSGTNLNQADTQLLKTANIVLMDSPDNSYSQVISAVIDANPNALLFNVANAHDSARSQHCEAQLLHTIPSYQMHTDALGQWFRTKRISDIFVLSGSHKDDKAYTQAFLQTAKKFKLEVVAQKDWQFSFDLRRSAFAEIPMFTRTSDQYEAVFAADTAGQFAYSLPFNTQYQVPVTGSAGLTPVAWHFTHEQWGARQMQNRFKEAYGRDMNDIDFAAYVAVISVSTALQKGIDSDSKALYSALLDQDMSIAAYKGRKLSYRTETRQLRQPILLAHSGALVTHAPLPGFLHQTNDLDTLGSLRPTCQESRR